MWRYKKEAKYVQGVGGLRNHLRCLGVDGKIILKIDVTGRGCEMVDRIYCIWLTLKI